MLIAKDLVIKCLLGAGVCAAGGGFGIYYNKNIRNRPAKKPEQSEADWIKSVGLDCGNGTFNNTGTDCNITANKLNVKHDETNKGENLSGPTPAGSAKVKVYKLSDAKNGYNKNLKFVVEGGDINVTAAAGASSKVSKLEEFETYEIKEDKSKWYLTRKDKASEKIKKDLGLPCDLPTAIGTPTSCNDINTDKLKALNFDGKNDGGATITDNGTATLIISKVEDTAAFPFGYKFSLQPTKKVTISSAVSVEENTKTDFKIKKGGTNLTLEKAWTLDKLAEKVGLESCSNSDTCTIKDGSFNFKQDDTKEEGKKKTNGGSGKIKVYKDDKGKGYENGFKFVIEEGDISIGESTSNKLEEFETYEITEVDKKYYLTRKEKASKRIGEALGLPTDCQLPDGTETEKTCENLDATKLKGIKFDGKDDSKDPSFTESGKKAKLKITKLSTTDTNFPLNYKFEFTSDESDITIQGNSNKNITIKKKIGTEFKIKKDGTNKTSLSLEKAWSAAELGKKVGLKCENSTNKECTFETENKVNVYNDNNDKVENAKVKDNANNDKKIKYEEDKEGYNQGFKFYVENNDIELECGTSGGTTSTKIKKQNGTSDSYEIKQDGGKWYLYKKTTS